MGTERRIALEALATAGVVQTGGASVNRVQFHNPHPAKPEDTCHLCMQKGHHVRDCPTARKLTAEFLEMVKGSGQPWSTQAVAQGIRSMVFAHKRAEKPKANVNEVEMDQVLSELNTMFLGDTAADSTDSED